VHLHRAEADLVDTADIPAAMMQAGRIRIREGEDVMIAAVHAVHECDGIRTVREAKPEIAAVEFDRPVHIRREHQHVRQAARPYRRRVRA
jgi:hypothetical protein